MTLFDLWISASAVYFRLTGLLWWISAEIVYFVSRKRYNMHTHTRQEIGSGKGRFSMERFSRFSSSSRRDDVPSIFLLREAGSTVGRAFTDREIPSSYFLSYGSFAVGGLFWPCLRLCPLLSLVPRLPVPTRLP